jgi:hypothetical protein
MRSSINRQAFLLSFFLVSTCIALYPPAIYGVRERAHLLAETRRLEDMDGHPIHRRAGYANEVLPFNGRMFSLYPAQREVFLYWGWDNAAKESVKQYIQATPEIDWSRVLIELLLAVSIAGLVSLTVGRFRRT